MNDTFVKILKLLFNKTTMAYVVIGLAALYANFWFNKSEYSPKSIKESIDNNGEMQKIQAKASLNRDSLLWEKVNDMSHEQYIMRMQFDTVIKHQTPEVIKNLKLIQQISNDMRNMSIVNEVKTTSQISDPISPLNPIKEPIFNDKYSETITLIDEIELTMKADTSKKKNY